MARSRAGLLFQAQSKPDEMPRIWLHRSWSRARHKPPTLIKERVEKDYASVLRTALTGINRVNKTDVEILRGSIGVRHPLMH